MHLRSVSVPLLSLLLLACAVAAASQVSLAGYSYGNNVLAGSIKVQNIAYTKVVKVHWAASSGAFADAQTLAASYAASGSDGVETWRFSGAATGATEFYVRYDVAGSTYYDPGNYVNYQITPATTTTSAGASATRCTVTTTTTVTRA
ncbi:hypothetical protein EDC01DRAFT_679799 [Geopyxis carbonaria]|nr:hypothetical protein EDC01DRAFT_679799 [Geopyxis carbonaria]